MSETSRAKHPTNPTPAHQFLTLVYSSAMGQVVSVAAELRIADLLADGPKSVQEIATATNANALALTSIMRTLGALDLVTETPSGTFELTEVGEIMRSHKPGSLGKFAARANRDYFHSMWANLMHSVKTGESAYEAVHGMTSYEFYQQHPEEQALYQEAMSEQTHMEALGVRDSYDFSNVKTVVDAGGGRGYLLKTILDANPMLKGILFDLPAVVDGAAQTFESPGLAGRASVVEGNFFEGLPRGGDLYIFKRVFVDKTDEQAMQVLTNCRAALDAEGKVLIIDTDISSLYGKLFDIFVLGMFGSRIRDEEEWHSLFADTGFQFTRTINADSALMLVEAKAV
jgi:hypothetical protein